MNFNTQFTLSAKQSPQSDTSGEPLRILIIGDYSGRGSRGLEQGFCGGKKKIVAVDKDNFNDVFSAMGIEIQTPFAEETLRFNELEDLHPDYLYQQLPLFQHFRTAIYRLGKCTTQEQAQKILEELGFGTGDAEGAEPGGDAPRAEQGFSLESLLDSSAVHKSSSSGFDVQAIIKDIVSPYAVPAADHGVAQAEALVWQALNDALRALMQHTSFKSLESIWCALDRVNRRLDTDSQFKLHILDATGAEMCEVLNSAGQAQGLTALLTQRSPNVAREPFDIIVLDSGVGEGALTDKAAQALAKRLSSLCSQIFLGVEADFCEQVLDEGINAFSAPGRIAGVSVFAPRMLLRMPYGSQTASIEVFEFEEIPDPSNTDNYLWASGAYLGLLALAEWAEDGTQCPATLKGLPFVAVTHDDEPFVQPGLEFVYSDAQAQKLATAGISVVRGSQRAPDVTVPALAPT